MLYKVLLQFRDLTDGHLYNAGDKFPHDGRVITPARIEELSTGQNKAKKALIEAVEEIAGEIAAPAKKTQQRAARKPKAKA